MLLTPHVFHIFHGTMFGYVVINVPTRTSELGPIFYTKFKGILPNSLIRMCLFVRRT